MSAQLGDRSLTVTTEHVLLFVDVARVRRWGATSIYLDRYITYGFIPAFRRSCYKTAGRLLLDARHGSSPIPAERPHAFGELAL